MTEEEIVQEIQWAEEQLQNLPDDEPGEDWEGYYRGMIDSLRDDLHNLRSEQNGSDDDDDDDEDYSDLPY